METRRTFIIKSGLAIAAASLPLPVLSKSRDKSKLGVALAGLGYYSRDLLAPALQLTKHCELKGIISGTPSKIDRWQKRYGIKDSSVYNYDNMAEMANNPDIDIVYVVTPNALHKTHAIAAANAGKHVWCEKPMATNAQDCQHIIDACNKNGVQLAIGYRMQHEPVTQEIINWGKSLPFGKILKIKSEAGFKSGGFDKNHWKLFKKLGGGAMFDMGVYPLNAARYSSGMEPLSVSARQKVYRTDVFEADEETTFTLEFPEGIIANCKTSFAEFINELHIDCEKGWYNVKPMQSYTGVSATTSNGTRLKPFIGSQQANQMDNDALAIKNKIKPLVPGEEGLRDIIIVDAIFKSAHENGKLIKL